MPIPSGWTPISRKRNWPPIHEGDPAKVKLMGYSQIVRGEVGSVARGINVSNAQPEPAGAGHRQPDLHLGAPGSARAGAHPDQGGARWCSPGRRHDRDGRGRPAPLNGLRNDGGWRTSLTTVARPHSSRVADCERSKAIQTDRMASGGAGSPRRFAARNDSGGAGDRVMNDH